MLIINILLGIDKRDVRLQIWANLVPKLICVLIFINFSTQSKSSILIINMLLETLDLELKLQIWANFVSHFPQNGERT